MFNLRKPKRKGMFEDFRNQLLKEAKTEKEKQEIRQKYTDEFLEIADKSFKENLYPAMKKLSEE
ncbi:MAG: hypothetical protein F4X82_00170 [Candidatus Spechtbacteria bacterium SB0662_bin_43]|uniref:Uncharacterized protein n=1 Tax=Candidatus Spechtbacteria bacterium SB0662_bin_43 TaxID=2604897 RepID=A0A845D983_9BACT|nr:hypothetical protein [Candidatus Spechtbacteria bacterium SB0662_bin_43]